MNKVAILLASSAAMAASPAFAQSANGVEHSAAGRENMPGANGGGMGAGPPMSIPGGASDARDIAAQRGDFGHDQALNQTDKARMFEQRSLEYRQDTLHRAETARADLATVRNGGKLAMASDDIREQFERDMREWRDTFGVDRQAWQEMRDAWLADKDSLTAEEWAQRRAAWFDQRDDWIAKQEEWAKSHAH